MTAENITIKIGFDHADLQAFFADVEASCLKYGLPEDCAPHNRAKLDAELDRAVSVLCACSLTTISE